MDPSSDNDLVKIRRRIESHPADLQARYELGVALCNRGDYITAIPELQRAMASPSVRLQTMALLADAFDSRGMREMATRTRQQISDESGDEGDSGSVSLPIPKRPLTPRGSAGAQKIPE